MNNWKSDIVLTCVTKNHNSKVKLHSSLLLHSVSWRLSEHYGFFIWTNHVVCVSNLTWQKAVVKAQYYLWLLCFFLPLSVWQSQKQNIDLTRQAKFASTPAFALFVTLKNVVCKIGEDAEVLMSLYDPVESKFVR